jgi:putative ABC transport system substrate-binding protein
MAVRPTTARLTTILVLLLMTATLATAAQQHKAGDVPRIGHLSLQPWSATAHLRDAFRQGLRELGYVEGQNIAIDFRNAEGRLERLPDLAAELVRVNVDVIVAAPEACIQAAKQATSTIPVVMAASEDPVGRGFVASLARPGGNVTGLSSLQPALVGKQVELLKEMVPKLSRVAALWDMDTPSQPVFMRETEVAARALGLQVQALPLRGPKPDFESAFRAATSSRAGALSVVSGPLLLAHRAAVVDLAARSRLPAIYNRREYVDAGGLISYGPNLPAMHRRAAAYVDRILKGAKPRDLPVEQPTKFELIINGKTAKALGLTIPPSLLLRADQIIE